MSTLMPTFNLPKDPKALADLQAKNLAFREQLHKKLNSKDVDAEFSESFCKEVSAMLKQARAEGIYPLPPQ